MNVLTDNNKEVTLPQPVKLSASAARRRRRRRRPRSNSALLAALPLDQREMFRNLWRATLQAFVGSQGILGEGEPSSPNVSMRDDAQARNRDVVKVRNVLLGADADADHVTRGRRNILDSEGLNSPLRKDGIEPSKKRDKKCKKRSRRSRSCSTDSSSSDSNSEYSDHSTDRSARKKSHRHKKKKKEKRKAKKRSRDSKDDSVDVEKKKAKRERHKRKKDSSSRKSRRDLPRNSEKNIQKSKLSFSPYADEEDEIKERIIEKGPGAQLCLRLPTNKLNGPVWVGGSSEEEKSCSSRDSLSLNRKDRNGNSVKQPLNGRNDSTSKDSSSELQTLRSAPEKRRSDERAHRKVSNNDSASPAAPKDASTQRKSSSSPDCAKIRRILANKKTPPQDSATGNGKPTSTTNGSRNHSVESVLRDASSRDDMSKWEKGDDLPVAYRSRSVSQSESSSRSRSRSVSRRSRSTSRRSDSRRRSSSRSTYSSRSRSKSFSSRSSRSRSYSRSHSRHRSLSIPRRSGSPSFLDKRRITSARKRPVPYNRYRNRSLSPESSDDDAKS